MQAIDFSQVLGSTAVQNFIPPDAEFDEDIYPANDGMRFRSRLGKNSVVEEIVRLTDGALLFVSQTSSRVMEPDPQIVSDGDWIHIQFRISGGGHEDVGGAGVVATPESSCIVARYPENSVIERTVDARNGWKVACLFIKPRVLSKLIDVTAPARVPDCASWLALDEHLELRSSILPLQSSMRFAVNDMLACTFRGLCRRLYMRAKSLELLALVLQSLGSSPHKHYRSKLSELDLKRISSARAIMLADLENSLTLAELACRVGVNRTKLALGFKRVYGISVQAFWRDARLDRAREMLRDGETPVSKVALSLGYVELSSFTRAFTRRFGVLPRDCRADARLAHAFE